MPKKTVPLTNALREEYRKLYDTAAVTATRAAEVEAVAKRIRDARARYEAVQAATHVPWYVVGTIHQLEGRGRWNAHLHNGDPLTARTVRVPAGRPVAGTPPFTWEASAIDALRGMGFDRWQDWSIPGTLYCLERYNGMGYRLYHPDVLSPYLWSFTGHYTRGKYASDGKYDAALVSKQAGAATLLKVLAP